MNSSDSQAPQRKVARPQMSRSKGTPFMRGNMGRTAGFRARTVVAKPESLVAPQSQEGGAVAPAPVVETPAAPATPVAVEAPVQVAPVDSPAPAPAPVVSEAPAQPAPVETPAPAPAPEAPVAPAAQSEGTPAPQAEAAPQQNNRRDNNGRDNNGRDNNGRQNGRNNRRDRDNRNKDRYQQRQGNNGQQRYAQQSRPVDPERLAMVADEDPDPMLTRTHNAPQFESRGQQREMPTTPEFQNPEREPSYAAAENLEGPKPRGLTLLGKTTVYSDRYSPALLETFENRHRDNDTWVKFNCPEFTSLCPITGQPDFATLYISYIPDRKMVESKSLKLYLFGFRNHGAFHEDCVNIIMKDLIQLMAPRYIEVWGKFLPRGGISIDPYANYGKPSTRYEDFARQRMMMHDLTPERVDNR